MTKKDDELELFHNLLRMTIEYYKNGKKFGEMPYVRDVIEGLSIPEGRGAYILSKWHFYNYGVSIMAGWLELDKITDKDLKDFSLNNQ